MRGPAIRVVPAGPGQNLPEEPHERLIAPCPGEPLPGHAHRHSQSALDGLCLSGSATNMQLWMADSHDDAGGLGVGIRRWDLTAGGVVAPNDTGITTVTNGTAEIITDGADGLIVQDPNNVEELAAKIRLLFDDAGLQHRLGENAALTARQYTWDRNGEEIRTIFADALLRKAQRSQNRRS